MIVTVTPNTAIDKTYIVEGFGLDRVHRPSLSYSVAGGKGINVARVLKTLGREAIATGFIGGANGDAIVASLENECIKYDFVRVNGESRLCIAIIDPRAGTQTEVNENGPEISENEVQMLLEKVANLASSAEYVVLCGSCPPGVNVSFYGDMIKIIHKCGSRAILDTSGEHLKEAIKAGPFMVKPNVAELSQLAGRELLTLEEISRAAKSLKQFGVSITAVTMGRSGAMVTDGVHSWKAVPPEIKFASAVGSGDSFVAAFIDSLLRGTNIVDALVYGTACGAANAATYGAGFCSKESIMELVDGVTLTKIN